MTIDSTSSEPAESQGPTLRRVARTPVGFVVLSWLSFALGVGIFGRWLLPHDPALTNPRASYLEPFQSPYWLGTDSAGRDVLSRMIVSTQNSLLAVVIAVSIALVLGVIPGLISGYYAGRFEKIASWVANLVMAMPSIVILLAARTVLGTSILLAMATFGILLSPVFYRLVSTISRAVSTEAYIDAAQVSGISDWRIVTRHVLRVVRGPIIIQTAIVCAVAIAVLSGLALIGFGDAATPTWGTLLSSGFSSIYKQRWLLAWPSGVIALTSLSLALLGSILSDELQGKTSTVPRSKANADQPNGDHESKTIDSVEQADDVHALPSSAPARGSLLSVRGLMVGYPSGEPGQWNRVVNGVDLDIEPGEVHCLVGESGSGKTQTAFAILGLLGNGGELLGGSVTFDGHDLTDDQEGLARLRGRRIAYVPQEPMSNLDPSFRVGRQLVEPLRVCLGIGRREARERALEMLERVDVPDPQRVFDSYPHQLSGGMAQRVLIAGAVASGPDLLIADEPTTALDVTVQAEILDLLREVQAETGMAMLLVTHNFGVVADIADRVSVMQDGQIVEAGAVRDVFFSAQHPHTRTLLGAVLDDRPPRSPYRRLEKERS